MQEDRAHRYVLNTEFELFKSFGNLVDNLLLDCRATWASEVIAGRHELHPDSVLPSIIHGVYDAIERDKKN